MSTEVIRYTQLGKEDIRFGTGTFEVILADGRKVVLREVNLAALLTEFSVATATIGSGIVLMIRSSAGAWIVYAPDGSVINHSASTTDGLQEAITYACDNGYDLEVVGGGSFGTAPNGVPRAVITCTTGIVMPPIQSKKIHLGNVTVNFSAAVTGTGWLWNSFEQLNFELTGQITYQGTGAIMEFKPTNVVVQDNVVICSNSKLFMTTLAQATASQTAASALKFTWAGGAFNDLEITVLEINGLFGASTGKITDGIDLTGATGGFVHCFVRAALVHDFSGTGVLASASINVAGSLFDFNIQLNSSSTTGVNWNAGVSAGGGRVRLNVQKVSGSSTVGLLIGVNAVKTLFEIDQNDADTPLTNNSVGTNLVSINGRTTFAWTPAFTFATPGNLNIAYSIRIGWCEVRNDRVECSFTLETSTFTHTTASGIAKLTGLPFTARTVANEGHVGSLGFSGITVGSFTQFCLNIESNTNYADVRGMGSAQAYAQFTPAEFPTGGTLVLRGTLTYWK